MIVDVTLNQLKKLFVAGSTLLRFEKKDVIYLYYIQQSQVVFRTMLERPEEAMQYQLLLNSLPQNLPVLNVVEDGAFEGQMVELLQDMLARLENIENMEKDGRIQN